MGAEETHTALAAAVRADYAAARTVAIDNWILSDTEARLSALAALVTRDGGDHVPAHEEEAEAHG